MLKSELLALIQDIDDTSDIDDVVSPNYLNLEVIKSKFNSDKDFKSWLDSEKDKHYSKALETWKNNKGSEYAVEKYYELYPDKKPKDEKDLLIEQLMREKADNERLQALEKLKNKALTELTNKGLHTGLIDELIGKDEATTLDKINKFSEIIEAVKMDTKQQFIKDNGYTPPKGGNDPGQLNPYDKKTWSLQKQMELEMNDPELAKKLRELVK